MLCCVNVNFSNFCLKFRSKLWDLYWKQQAVSLADVSYLGLELLIHVLCVKLHFIGFKWALMFYTLNYDLIFMGFNVPSNLCLLINNVLLFLSVQCQ